MTLFYHVSKLHALMNLPMHLTFFFQWNFFKLIYFCALAYVNITSQSSWNMLLWQEIKLECVEPLQPTTKTHFIITYCTLTYLMYQISSHRNKVNFSTFYNLFFFSFLLFFCQNNWLHYAFILFFRVQWFGLIFFNLSEWHWLIWYIGFKRMILWYVVCIYCIVCAPYFYILPTDVNVPVNISILAF